ncbi:MAG: 5'-nucleotidase C-terminal domain-containing protein, partial [Hyphomicrobiales bacterium]|nr:5'-nucleotidase C-terminal domain-containing protein [Hyphomicrobiales bacterium]
ERKLAGELDQEIGRLTTPMTSRNAVVRARESAIGNLIADAMRWATGADVALTNGGGIRANRDYEAGTMLTRRDILAELPFGNKTVVLEITGAQLMDVLRWGFISAGRGGFPQVSNMEAIIAVGGGPVPTLTSVTIDGTPLDPGRVYVLATNDFLANGGDGYAMLEGIPRIIDETEARLMASHVIDYIVVHGEVAPEIEGRIVIR